MALNHEVQGSVNYTVVGSPTIVDGVASGFSTSNYLRVGVLNDFNDISIFIKFKTGTDGDITGPLFFRGGNGYASFGIKISSANQVALEIRKKDNSYIFNQSVTTSFNFQTETIYYALLQSQSNIYNWKILNQNKEELFNYSYTASETIDNIRWAIGGQVTDRNYDYFRGSIDLNETYIKVNGEAWFGKCPVEVKHINYGTSVGYTKVGSPTISNGVVSGFSSSNGINTDTNFLSTYTNYEIVVKAKRTSGGGGSGLFAMATGNEGNFRCSLSASKFSFAPYIYSDDVSISETFSSDVWYYLRVQRNGATITISYSTDGENWQGETSKNFEQLTTNSSTIRFGRVSTASSYFNGSIDFNETYIKINGKLWFYRPATNYLVKDNKLIWADSGIYVQEPSTADYTIVGSPTVSSGVMSGFTNSDYAEIRQEPPSGTINSFEFIFSFNANSITASQQMIFGRSDSAKYAPNIYILNNRMYISMYDSTNGMYVSAGGNGSNLAPNTNYTFKATWVKDDYKVLYLYMKNGDNWVQYDSYARLFTPVWDDTVFRIGNDRTLAMPFNGSIDLNNCSFTVNGDTWWPAGGGSGAKNYATPNMAPVPAGYHTKGQVGCTAVGNPTIVDGVVSGFDSSNYLKISSNLENKSISALEFFTKIVVGETLTNAQIFLGWQSKTMNGLSITNDGRIRWVIARVDGTSTDIFITSSLTITKGNIVIVNAYYAGDNTFVLKASKDNRANWTTDTITCDPSTLQNLNSANLSIGNTSLSGYNRYFDGSVDLNETYIKVNNEMWFDGKGQYPFTGYVDIPTQAFTPAPIGSTWGKDE